ncbi:MAG: peptide chain release factor N(5)-glutamine methyltransferase [Enterobacteriaceae bacterium]
MKIKHCIKIISSLLNKFKYRNCVQKSERIISLLIKKKDTYLVKNENKKLKYKYLKKIKIFMKKIKNEESIEHALGYCNFWKFKLFTSIYTIVPRYETECLIEKILKMYENRKLKVLELGTGIGNISISLAYERKMWKITAIDFIENLIKISKKNAKNLNLKNIKFITGSWFHPVKYKKYNIIVSNPPYLTKKYINTLIENYQYECISSLIGGEDGLIYINYICKNAYKYLFKYGSLFIEHACDQGSKVRRIMKDSNLSFVKTYTDYSKKERFTFGKLIF